jgi:hypothetical protein
VRISTHNHVGHMVYGHGRAACKACGQQWRNYIFTKVDKATGQEKDYAALEPLPYEGDGPSEDVKAQKQVSKLEEKGLRAP